MRWNPIVLSLLLPACGLKEMLPQGPAVDAVERAAFAESPSGAAYSGESLTAFPVLPVIVWGAAYDLDLVLVSRHPEWNMHEYARLNTPRGPVWLAKDARESTMAQSIVADIPDIDGWYPELPIARKASPVEVEDRSTADWLDLILRYENIDGEAVEVTYAGKPPTARQKKRNGSTMGHSRDAMLAVLDLPLRDFGRRATVRIGGEPVPIKRLLGLVPFQMALVQTQGGLASGDLRIEPAWEEGLASEASAFATPEESAAANPAQLPGLDFDTLHIMPSGALTRAAWEVDESDTHLEARQTSPMRTLAYRFRKGERGSRELVEAWVQQYGYDQASTHIAFAPALPDLGHRFHGEVESRFVIDIQGQEGHAVGRVVSRWGEEGPEVRVIPEAPWWTADRPLTGRFMLAEDGGVDVTIRVDREPTE